MPAGLTHVCSRDVLGYALHRDPTTLED